MEIQQLELCPRNISTDPARYRKNTPHHKGWEALECLGVSSSKKPSLEPSLDQELPSWVPTAGYEFPQLLSRLLVLPSRLGSLIVTFIVTPLKTLQTAVCLACVKNMPSSELGRWYMYYMYMVVNLELCGHGASFSEAGRVAHGFTLCLAGL